MSKHQLSLLQTVTFAPCDVNAVDHGHLYPSSIPASQDVSADLASRAVDDWVFGLGFTNWKTVIDHALQTGHLELFPADESGFYGLRKHGYRYAPISRLPRSGVTYIQQQLLNRAADRVTHSKSTPHRATPFGSGYAYKCVVSCGTCLVEISGTADPIRVAVPVAQLAFSDDAPWSTASLRAQVDALLANAGMTDNEVRMEAAKLTTAHLTRLASSQK